MPKSKTKKRPKRVDNALNTLYWALAGYSQDNESEARGIDRAWTTLKTYLKETEDRANAD